MENNNEVIIEVNNLTKDYGYGRGVFDISVKIHKGECFGYLGPNGAGKSTTIRHIMGFAKPTVGTVKIFGIDSFGNTDKILSKVGYLPGEPAIPAGLDGWGFIRMMQGMRGEANEERLNYLLDLFKFNPGLPVKQMSLGDKRKLAVVAAFMNDPDVLVLDEPTSGLDPVMQKVFIKFIIEEKKRGKTILLSSHIFSEVDATCDTISIIKDGHHVSTFNANEMKQQQDKTFLLYFARKEDMEDYLNNKNKYEVVYTNEDIKLVVVKFASDLQNEFIHSLYGVRIEKFEEKPFTLQDYFMSFYKEDRDFGGLSGVKGNSKEGLARKENE
ncbi:MAG: ABC transporter ATP-binding protein [Bacilli bacterium]|nr:ABC transporter ATP-binding protein [Bacilli bacterium]